MCIAHLVAMAIHDYSYRLTEEESSHIAINKTSFYLELICDIFFVIETILSIVAKGLVEVSTQINSSEQTINFTNILFLFLFLKGDNSYLKSLWNWLNIFSLIGSAGERLSSSEYHKGYFRPIKMIRIMRINVFFARLKNSLRALIATIPELSRVSIGLFSIMVLYSIVGLHLFQGALEFRCRETAFPSEDGEFPYDPEIENLCTSWECPEGYFSTNSYSFFCFIFGFYLNPPLDFIVVLRLSMEYILKKKK